MTRALRLAALLLLAFGLWAQTDGNKGQIVGTVQDANGSVIPNAKVTVRNTQTGLVRELTSNEVGQYRAVQLDPGSYEIVATSAGLAPATLAGVTVNVGSSVQGDITLQVQATTVTVDVSDTLINVALPAPSTVLNNQAIENLPILGRRFQDFAALTPTVQIEPQRQQLSFVGQRGINANVLLDGSDYTQPFFGGIRGGERSNFAFTVPQSAIQEFQVVTTGYSAEYGRSTGGILNAITKNGTNQYTGEAFYQIRHKELGLNNPIVNLPLPETLQQFGGAIGGPIWRDRLFFFAAAEQQYSKQPRTVLFSSIAGAAATPDIQPTLDFFRSQEQRYSQTNDATATTGRLDYQFQAGHRLTARYNFSNNNAENAVSVGGATSPVTNSALSNEGVEKNRTHTGTVQYTHLFSPTIVNDFRYSAQYEVRPRIANAETPSVSSSIGTFGARNFLPTTQDDTRNQLINSLSLSAGTHTVKVGVDYARISTFQSFGFNQFGAFNFTTSNVGQILDILTPGGTVANRFDSPLVTYTRQIGDLIADYGVHQIAFYAQDSWRANNKLTLDFGLRYEAQLNPTPVANNQPVVDLVRNARFANGQALDPTRIPDVKNQWAPRFGFAWTPTSGERRTVVRGHTGLFYAATPLILFSGATNNFRIPPGDVSIQLTGTNPAGLTVYQQLAGVGVDLNRSALDQLPVIPIETVQRAAQLAQGGAAVDPFRGVNLLAVAPDYKNPRAYQAGFGVESEVVANFVAGIQLNYVNTVYLQRNRDYNLPLPTVNAQGRPVFNRANRPIPTLNQITVRESSARAMYRGATFQGQYRLRRVQFGAFYTLSETFSDDDNERSAGGFEYDNPFNLGPEYNYSNLDARHQFTFNAVATLPYGFEVSGLGRFRTGYPINPRAGSDLNTDLSNTDRPFINGVPFERNQFRNRGFRTVDFRVLKNFPFGERVRLQFSTEFFNLFNADNVVFAGNNLVYGTGPFPNFFDARSTTIPTFQRLRLNDAYDLNNSQLGNPLQVQFGLRLFF